MLEHQLDGAFVCGPVDHPALEETVVFREELVLATAAPAAGLEALAGAEAPRILVLRAGCSYRQRLEDVLARRGIVAVRRLEFGTLDAIFGCVAAGLGITLMPRAVVEAAALRSRIAVHALTPAEAEVETVFIRRRDALEPSALRAFLDVAREAADGRPALAAE